MTSPYGTRLGRYEIRSKIGAGGMGEVYLARDTKLDRKVALKILPAKVAQRRDRMARFVREAKAAAALNHPNIAHIYEIGEDQGAHFIAMEFVDGVTLREKIHREHAEFRKLLRYLQQVAEALAKAHTAGIVHRDLKPENIMITRDDYAKILDFGLAKLIEARGSSDRDTFSSEITTVLAEQSLPGSVIGTVGYMSPEQAQGRLNEIDHRSDIFSFGCILYEAASGQKAFEGVDALDSLHKIVHAPTPQISEINPAAPAELQRIVRRCLAKDREDRYQTIKDVAIELRELRRELASGAGIEDTAASKRFGVLPAVAQADDAGSFPTQGSTPSLTHPSSSVEYMLAGIKQHKLAMVIVALVLASGVVGLVAYLHARNTEVAIESIAVLPFANQNHDPDSEYLSDGLTESIINSLTQLPNLKVIARSSVFRYKGKETDPMAIGNELGVRTVLTGRILQRGDNLMISTELLDVRDNKQLWGEQYSEKISDLLSVQREIAKEITGNLRLKLSGAEQNRVAKHYTENPEAYQLYLKGRFYWNKRTEEGVEKGIEYFQQAVEKDPKYALAYTGLADSYSLLTMAIDVGSLSPTQAIPKARAAAMKALELDDTLAEAHTSLAFIKLNYDWDWSASEKEFKRAIELDPNSASAHHWYSHYLMAMGRIDESLAESKRALELDQFSLIINTHLGWHYIYAHQYDLAIEQLRKTIDMDPNYGMAHWYLGLAYEQSPMYAQAGAEIRTAKDLLKNNVGVEAGIGRVDALSGKRAEAQKVIDELKDMSKQIYVSSYHVASIYASLGDKERAFEWLENAYKERSDSLVYLKVDPKVDSLRSDPRFTNLVRRVGLPP